MNELVKLPEEVEVLAQNVSVEKRNEVQSVLNHVFNGVSKMRQQLDNVQVADENDKVSMKLANSIRLGVRSVRLDAEKNFDAKRNEVQQAMMSFKTEDALWLKAKQTMQILTKEIEEQAKWKESTAERFAAEQKELKTQQRILQVQKFAPDMSRIEFENMADSTFENFVSGLEKAHNDRIEAEKTAEAARLAAIEADRLERERIKSENERLQKEAEAKAKELEAERKKAADEASERERLAAIERKKQAEIEAENQRKIKAANEAKEAAEKQLREQAEAKAKAEKEAAEQAKKAAAAPDRDKIIAAVNSIVFELPTCKSKEMQDIANDINAKFESFKKWAIQQTEKI